MKRFAYIITLCILAVTMTACARYELEEDDEVIGNGENRLTLKLSPFEKGNFDVNPSSRAIVGINEVCSRISFAIFDSNGKKVASANQDSKTGNGFGTFNADLNDGVYDLVIVAHSTGGNATIAKPDSIRFTDNKVSDTFSYYERITLDGNLTKEIVIRRCVAMFRLQLTEKIPESVKFMKFYYTGGSSALDAKTGFGCINSRQTEIREVPESAYTSKDNSFEIYTIPHSTDGELKITVSGLAADGKSELDQIVFENVPISQGQITTYTGTIFNVSDDPTYSPSLPTSFTVKANDSWTELKRNF